MVFKAAIIILSLINLSVNLNCNQRNVTNIEEHLKLTLLCDYEPSRVPENSITINTLIELQDLYQTENLLLGNLIVMLTYNESSLAFDPKNYDNITEITVGIDFIWSPILHFYNNNMYGVTNINECWHECTIRFRGTVICKFTCYLQLECAFSAHKWPYDNLNCSFSMFTITNYGGHVQFIFDITADEKVDESRWKVIAYEVYIPDIKSSLIYPVFGVSVLSERHSYVEFYSTMYPLYTIFVITFIAFVIEFDALMRIILIAVTIYLELQLAVSIDEGYFKQPDRLPIALVFYRLTFITSCFLMCETMILRNLTRKLIIVPHWFTHVEFLSKFSVFNLYLGSRTDESFHIISHLSENNLKWRVFCAMIDRLFFIIWFIYNTFVIIY